MDSDSKEITGPIKSAHQFVNMPEQEAEYETANGTIIKVSCVYISIEFFNKNFILACF